MNPRAGQGRTRTWRKSVWTQPGAGADTTRESGSDARTAAHRAGREPAVPRRGAQAPVPRSDLGVWDAVWGPEEGLRGGGMCMYN